MYVILTHTKLGTCRRSLNPAGLILYILYSSHTYVYVPGQRVVSIYSSQHCCSALMAGPKKIHRELTDLVRSLDSTFAGQVILSSEPLIFRAGTEVLEFAIKPTSGE